MGRRYKYSCDGCGSERETTSEELPASWADVEVRIAGMTNWVSGGGETFRSSPLLCPACQIVLVDRADASRWARPNKPEKA